MAVDSGRPPQDVKLLGEQPFQPFCCRRLARGQVRNGTNWHHPGDCCSAAAAFAVMSAGMACSHGFPQQTAQPLSSPTRPGCLTWLPLTAALTESRQDPALPEHSRVVGLGPAAVALRVLDICQLH